jgi:hypothetical protein
VDVEPSRLPKRFNKPNPDHAHRRMAPAFYSTENGQTMRWLSTDPNLRAQGAPAWDPAFPGEAEEDGVRSRAFRWLCDPEPKCGRDLLYTGRQLARLLKVQTGQVVMLGL